MTGDVAALMVTNPNTLGVFEDNIVRVAEILHKKGAMLYMDGANMNALVGIARPGDFGVDVMHLNLHKTFSTPHGGGGPGAGPVAVKKVLEPFLPTPRLKRSGKKLAFDYKRKHSIGRVKAFYGNFGVLVRALAYILAHGGPGLRNATMDAVLNAIYIRKGLEPYYDLPYQSPNMHEVVFSDDRQAQARRAHRRYRQAPHRLRLPPLHRQLPADRPRRAHDRAHRNRRQARNRQLHRRHDLDRARDRDRPADGEERAPQHPHQPRGRSHRRAQAGVAMEARVAPKALLLLMGLVLLIRLPFLNQAIQGDDHIYLTEAQHALIDPLHPSDVKYVFLGDEVDLRGHSHPPGNAWPLAGLAAALRRRPRSSVPRRVHRVFADRGVGHVVAGLPLFGAPAVGHAALYRGAGVRRQRRTRSKPTSRSWPSGWPSIALFLSGRLLLAACAMAAAAMMAYQAVFLIPILFCGVQAPGLASQPRP